MKRSPEPLDIPLLVLTLLLVLLFGALCLDGVLHAELWDTP